MLGGSGSTETAPELCEVSLNLQYPKSWTCSPLDLTKDLADKMNFPYDIGTPPSWSWSDVRAESVAGGLDFESPVSPCSSKSGSEANFLFHPI